MDVIEFLEHSNHRNLKNNIAYMVKQRMRELEENLHQKRVKLWEVLKYESLIYDEELALLVRTRIEENARKRHEWLNMKRIERQLQEQKLLELKNLQRELEACEAMRHLQSKQILKESKEAQLYQIAEKRAIKERERHIEELWRNVAMRLNNEKEKQEAYEKNLCKKVALSTQAVNIKQHEEQEMLSKSRDSQMKQAFMEDDARANWLDQVYRDAERSNEKFKKLHQGKILQDQIQQNFATREYQKRFDVENDTKANNHTTVEIINDLNRKDQEKIINSLWWQDYMKHVRNENMSKIEREDQFNDMYLGTGCVVAQQPKKPYSKLVR